MIYIPIKIPWILPYITHMVCCHMFPIYRERQESACMYSCMSIHYANIMILKPCICLEKKLLRPRLPTQDVAKDSVDTLAATLKGTDALIIATGFVPGNPFAMNAEAHAVDNLGTKALVDAAKMSGVNKIVPCIDESQRHDGLLNWGLTYNIYIYIYILHIHIICVQKYAYCNRKLETLTPFLGLKQFEQMGKRSCNAQVLVSSILTNGRGWGQENSPGFQVARLNIVFSSQDLPLQPTEPWNISHLIPPVSELYSEQMKSMCSHELLLYAVPVESLPGKWSRICTHVIQLDYRFLYYAGLSEFMRRGTLAPSHISSQFLPCHHHQALDKKSWVCE